ncbi:FkbM family methyltransferase [Alloacidobacterium sp.]|uniref:FkbM family methyltransferase n=1 Tax=Alloacidobacterium sp. TaxID=2951999 RepID=UPI002D3099C3|nr:FkbM family methyltransferase [Alloacidobacterium sp.]HYK37106.1 FkbM family methyltransferase [Alloacidobacterium sp.]
MASFVRRRFDFHMQMYAAQQVRLVNLDGCVIDMKRLPDSQTKIDLAKKAYEVAERTLIPKYLDRRLPVIEFGGCIGVIACITNRLLENPERHVVVEANPLALPLLKETREGNQCTFEILNKAIAYGVPVVTFRPTSNLCANSLRENGGEESYVHIPATTLRKIVDERKFESFNLICDIEGHEYDLVLNEPNVLQKATTIILETHARLIGDAKNAQLLDNLANLGFEIINREETVVVLKQSRELNLQIN